MSKGHHQNENGNKLTYESDTENENKGKIKIP